MKLKRTLSLFDAVNIALGSIIGAGIFVIIGTAAKLSGPAVVVSVLVAAAVALMTGLASAELSKMFPKGGGAYTFAKEALSGPVGFVVGWVWLFSNVVTGATVALGFGHYASFFFPSISPNASAAALVVALTVLNLLGSKQSSSVNNVLVAVKVLILMFFVAAAGFSFKISNFTPLAPFGIGGILGGAAAIFFAYAGFARVAVVADEIKEPEKNVPLATILSLAVSTAIYLFVALIAVGAVGYVALSNSDSPLSDTLAAVGTPGSAGVMVVGALIATSTVVLATILGLSRIAYTMAENQELPGSLGKLDGTQVPTNAIIVSGIAMLAFALLADLPQMAYVSSFSLLLYYAAINASGVRVLGGWAKYAAAAGLVSCAVLMLALPLLSWVVGIAVVAAGAAYYWFNVRGARRTQNLDL